MLGTFVIVCGYLTELNKKGVNGVIDFFKGCGYCLQIIFSIRIIKGFTQNNEFLQSQLILYAFSFSP